MHNLPREVHHRDRLVRTDVDHSAAGTRLCHQPDDALHHITDVSEASRLPPCAVNAQVTTGQRTLDERRNHHSVRRDLTGAGHVEEPADDYRQPVPFRVTELGPRTQSPSSEKSSAADLP